jgi:hypothetical protein
VTPSAPLGTQPIHVDGFANYTFELAEGTYYLGMAAETMGRAVEASLTNETQIVATKEVSYEGARRLGLLAGVYHLALRGRGTVVIALDAQSPGSYRFAGLSTTSFFLIPQGNVVNLAVITDANPTARLAVYDALMHLVVDTTVSAATNSLRVTLPAGADDFTYTVVTAPGSVIQGSLTWQSTLPPPPGPPPTVWLIPVVILSLLAIIAYRRRLRRRFDRRARK